MNREIESMLEESQSYYHKGEFENAIMMLTGIIEFTHSQFIDAFVLRAHSYYKLKDYKSAVNDMERAVKYKEISPDDNYVLGWSYYNILKPEKAKKVFNKVIDMTSGEYGNAYIGRLYSYYDSGEYEKIIEESGNVLMINPNMPELWIIIGWSLHKLEKYSEAKSYFEKAEELTGYNSSSAKFGLGMTYYELEEYDKAIELFEYITKVEAEHLEAWCYLGWAYLKTEIKEKFPEAIEAFNKAIALEPEYLYAFLGRGSVYDEMEKYEDAVNDYKFILEKDESWALGLVRIAWCYYYMEKKEKNLEIAMEYFTKSYSLHDEFYLSSLSGLGMTSWYLRKYNDAVKYLTEYLSLEEEWEFGWEALGESYYFLGKYSKALESYKKSLEINPDNFTVYVRRAEVHLSKNKMDLAAADYEKAVKNGKETWAMVMLGQNYLYGNSNHELDYKKGVALLERAYKLNNKDYPCSRTHIGRAHELGKGKKENKKKAFELYKEAAETETFCTCGKLHLAHAYMCGIGQTKNEETAFEMLQNIYENRRIQISGEHLLAYCFYHGFGTKKDIHKAISILEKSVKDGNIISCSRNYLLAVCYMNLDKEKAENYLKLAKKYINNTGQYEREIINNSIKNKEYEFFYPIEVK